MLNIQQKDKRVCNSHKNKQNRYGESFKDSKTGSTHRTNNIVGEFTVLAFEKGNTTKNFLFTYGFLS